MPERVVAGQKEGGVELIKAGTSDRDAIPQEHAVAILRAASVSRQEAARWMLAMLAGLRPGEACGLRWSDVDLGAGFVDVQWQRQELGYLDKADRSKGFRVPLNHESVHLYGTYHLTRPKNRRGTRKVPLVPPLAAALAAWKETAPTNPWDLVFTDADTRPGRQGNQLVRSKKVDGRAWLKVLRGRRAASRPARHPAPVRRV